MRFDSMRPPACRLLLAVAAAVMLAAPARADILNTFNSPGDVTLAGSQAPGVWYPDRYPPAGFAAGANGGGRIGVLQQDIAFADRNGSRPAAFNSAFYNTQGRKFDTPAGTLNSQVQLYVPSSWNGLNQSESIAAGQSPFGGRLASFWATSNTTQFPIIEFNNNTNGAGADGFRIWDPATGTWINVGGFAGYDQWYTLGFDVYGPGNEFRYFVNGSFVGSVSAFGSTSLTNVMLQGYNAGNSAGTGYSIFWDNLSIGAANLPEPTTLALFGLGAVGVLALRRRKAATV